MRMIPVRRLRDTGLGDTPPRQSIAAAAVSAGGVLTLHYFAGRGYEEIADALQVPLGTVKTQIHRAKEELRAILEADLKVRHYDRGNQ